MAEVVRDDQLPKGAGTAGEVPPVGAASIILVRDSPLQALMIRRTATSSFVPDVWVFPGGVLEEEDLSLSDGSMVNAMRIAAARELFEETGIYAGPAPTRAAATFIELYKQTPIDLEQLVWTSRWITPVGVPKRFDTYFFLASAGAPQEMRLQAAEAVDSVWISPADAVQCHMHGDFPLVFPTLKNLEAIVGFASVSELLESRRNAEIPATRPILIVEDGQKKIILP